MPQKTMTSNCLNKSMNKSLVKDNARRFVDREKHSYDLMKYALSPCQPHGTLTLPHLRIHLYQHICTAIFMQPIASNSRCCIHAEFKLYHDAATFAWSICASSFTLPLLCPIYEADPTCTQREAHLRSCIHTVAFTPQHLSCLHTTTFVLSFSRCNIPAIALSLQLSCHRFYATALTPQHWCSHSHAAAFMAPHLYRSIHASEFTMHLCSRI